MAGVGAGLPESSVESIVVGFIQIRRRLAIGGQRDPARLALRQEVPHDLWIQERNPTESVLYDRGARAATAPVVLFSEAHCVARPEAAGSSGAARVRTRSPR